jgi:N utilization substance protein B
VTHADDAGYGGRHEARERALALLYEAEQKGVPAAEVVDALPVAPDEFAAALVLGVDEHRDDLDRVIEAAATNWRLDRMAMLDRTVLRLGAFELLHRPDIPAAVSIDEAVELAKAYCGDESPRFVNGVLARIADDHPRP